MSNGSSPSIQPEAISQSQLDKLEPPDKRICPICLGFRFITEPGMWDSLSSKAIPCPEGCTDARTQFNINQFSGLTDERKKQNFDLNWHPVMSQPASAIKSKSTSSDPRGFILLAGPYGCGKSHLLAAAVNSAVLNGKTSLYIEAEKLLGELRRSYGKDNQFTEHEILQRLQEVTVLSIDELDRINQTEWAITKLFGVLNSRYNASIHGDQFGRGKLTIMATNENPKQLEGYLQSRLMDVDSDVYELWDAPDFRKLRGRQSTK